jgi:hypothetical protein
LVPNWNSMVMPVATPMAKLMPNRTPQNFTICFQITRPVITYTLSMIASSSASPKVSGTNRKWYRAVTANWSRESSTTCMSGMRITSVQSRDDAP